MKFSVSRLFLCATLLVVLAGCSSFQEMGLGWGGEQQKQQTASKQPAKNGKAAQVSRATQEALTTAAAQAGGVAQKTPETAANLKTGAQVAILLPLSGKNAALGHAMLNAAQLAVFDLAGNSFELMPRDTGLTEESASLAARDAVGSGARLLIGPLFAGDVVAVKPVVQGSIVNVLALSSDVSLAESGIYVMGFSPKSMVDRTVAFAARKGLTRYAGLFPSTAYGRLVRDAFAEAVTKNKGVLVSAEFYGAQDTLEKATRDLAAKKDQIDALFLPAGGEELQRVASALTAQGFTPGQPRLLGSGLWDDPTMVPNKLLEGGWYPAADPEKRESFVKNYEKAYGVKPPRLATLAYDATAMAIILARRGGSYDRAALTSPNGFAGVDGIFRLTAQGWAERGLAIHERTENGSFVLDSAPSTFASP